MVKQPETQIIHVSMFQFSTIININLVRMQETSNQENVETIIIHGFKHLSHSVDRIPILRENSHNIHLHCSWY